MTKQLIEEKFTNENGEATFTYEIEGNNNIYFVAQSGGLESNINYVSSEKTSLGIRIVWNDNDNKENLRPESIPITLTPKNKEAELEERNGWTYHFSNLPAKDENEQNIAYDIVLGEFPNYIMQSRTKQTNMIIITYKL